MKRVTVATIAVLMLACVLPMAQARETASHQEERISEQDTQFSQQMAELEAQLDKLRAQQEELQDQLRVLAEKRHQAAGQRRERPVEGMGEPGAPREAVPHVRAGGGGRPGTRDPGARADSERVRAESEVRRAREAERAAAEGRRPRAETERRQERAPQQQSRTEQMQKWQNDMEQWQRQMQEWAHAQAQRRGRIMDRTHSNEPPAPAEVPPMPVMPPIPAPIHAPAPLQEDMDMGGQAHVPEVHAPHIEPPHIDVPHVEVPMPPENPEHVANLEESVVRKSLTLDAIKGEEILEVANQMGSIAVRSGEGPGYRIVATIKGRAETLERARQIAERAELVSTPSPTGVRVSVAIPDDLIPRGKHGCAVELEVIAPRSARIKLSQAMGDIRLTGLRGHIDVFAQMGSIRARNVAGDVSLKTNMGEIDFVAPEGLSAKVQATTNFGSVQTDLPLEMAKSAHPGMGSTASGVVGPGEGNISLSTNMGSIRVRTQAAEPIQTF